MTRKSLMVLVTAALLVVAGTFWPTAANAEGREGGHGRGGGRVVAYGGYYSPFFYDPFWDPFPFYGYGALSHGREDNGRRARARHSQTGRGLR